MTTGLRQSQAFLHTWSGLVLGWLLYAMFLTGTVSYWREEITHWATPEIAASRIDTEAQAHVALDFLQANAAGAERWSIQLPDERRAGIRVSWRMPGERRAQGRDTILDDSGARVVARNTTGGDFFYRLHFQLHYVPVIWGRWIAGLAAMFMLVAIVSGVITHKKIFSDFFTFRRGKGQRSWLDGHNALAVLALPFHLMITYTGLVALMTLYMPFGMSANYASRSAFYAELFPTPAAITAAGEAASSAAITPMLRDARQAWGGSAVETIAVQHPGDRNARVSIGRGNASRITDGGGQRIYDGHTGATVWHSPERNAAVATRGVMIGLHAARFAPMTMRWLFFLSSVAGTLMVASGLVLWTVKRRAQLADPAHPHLGFRIAERLNISVIAGLPLAMAGFLWANRLLPASTDGRADLEIHAFFVAWLLCLAWSCLRPAAGAWRELLLAGALACTGLAVFELVSLSRAASGNTIDLHLGINLGLLGAGCLLALSARAVHRHGTRPATRQTQSKQVSPPTRPEART